MVEPMLWIERRFAFGRPAGHYPGLLERLQGTPARVEEILAGIPVDVLRQKPGPHYSLIEHVGHLRKVENLWETRFEQFRNGESELAPADMTNAPTAKADFNSWEPSDVFKEFRSNRIRFVAELAKADEELVVRPAHHPRLDTTMRLIDLVDFAAEHDDHHLAMIRQMLRSHS